MKKSSFWVLPLTAALALAGCSGSTDDASGGSDGGSATESSQPVTENSQSAAEQPAAQSSALTAAQTTEVLKAVVGDDSEITIMDGDTIAGTLESAKGLIEQMEIEPEQCAELVSQQSSWDLDGVNMSVAISGGADSTEAFSYSIAGYEDATKLEGVKKIVEAKDLQGCDNFSMNMGGQKVEASAKILEASSDADFTYATSTNMTINGTAVPTGSYQVQGLIGSNLVGVSFSGAGEEADVLKTLTEELNKFVAEVKAVAK